MSFALLGIYLGFRLQYQLVQYLGASLITITLILVFIFRERHPKFFEDLKAEVETQRYARTQIDGLNIDGIKTRIDELMQHNQVYLDEDLRMADLAKELLITPNQLSRILNEQYGKSFSEFINQHRIEDAKKLLLSDKDKSIVTIAYEVGFNTRVTFNTQFSKFAGQTPKEFRENNGGQI